MPLTWKVIDQFNSSTPKLRTENLRPAICFPAWFTL